ncbi:uncharacterized protein LOC110459801, partial [Mizuhopecten yessoensis]|uniref:uncharacterized protein LOC110459801 n=1 Tax=Mizuhopecten yessoensis TaxID=6573 RepID=UPI000B457FF5
LSVNIPRGSSHLTTTSVEHIDPDALRPPRDLRGSVRETTTRLSWDVNRTEEEYGLIHYFQITYEIVDPHQNFLRITHNIDGIKRHFTLRGLVPQSTYKTFMVTVGSGEVSNASDTVEFSTALPEENYLRLARNSIYPEEAIILLILIAIWVVAVVLFFKQWDSIRILQPMEPRYRHSPKNLECIKVVKRSQDSVIYKNYNRKLSVTMVAREKRHLQRMHTAPTLPTCSLIMSTLPTIQMEDVMTEM